MNNYNTKSIIIDDSVYETGLTKKYLNRKTYKPVDQKRVVAFIPGLIQKVFVKVGDKIKRGDKLLILEAMKMQNILNAPVDGVVRVVPYEGILVKKNELLVEIE
jgi:biotin carboxyl carrier protein